MNWRVIGVKVQHDGLVGISMRRGKIKQREEEARRTFGQL
jgi:hypothetical protein